MTTISKKSYHEEGLQILRIILVLSSLSPLFILWAIRGNCLIPASWFLSACILFAVVPNIILWYRICTVRKNSDTKSITVGFVEEHQSQILVYLFATLLPFYREEVATFRDLAAMIAALMFIVFLFWHLRLHYINIMFSIFKYHVFTVHSPDDSNPYTGKEPFVLITRCRHLQSGNSYAAYRLSDTVYMDMNS